MPDKPDYEVSALIRPMAGHTVGELKEILERSGASIREIVPGVLTFDGPESDLKAVESIAFVGINVDAQFDPPFY